MPVFGTMNCAYFDEQRYSSMIQHPFFKLHAFISLRFNKKYINSCSVFMYVLSKTYKSRMKIHWNQFRFVFTQYKNTTTLNRTEQSRKEENRTERNRIGFNGFSRLRFVDLCVYTYKYATGIIMRSSNRRKCWKKHKLEPLIQNKT